MRNQQQLKNILAKVPDKAHAFKNWEPDPAVMARFNPDIRAATGSEETTLNIFSNIGEYYDWWEGTTSGTTVRMVADFLKKADGRDVTININSPGGDYFEGLGIYNLLDQYEGAVHMRVIGLAASAASFVCMAGDTIDIAKAAFFMIHNSMTVAVGNKADMQECADLLAQLDKVMAEIYMDHTGQDDGTISSMLDAETWISGTEAVEMGFADGFLGDNDVVEETEKTGQTRALKRIDRALAKAGVARTERRKLIGAALEDDPDAAENSATPRAGKESPTPRAGFDPDFTASLVKLREVVTA